MISLSYTVIHCTVLTLLCYALAVFKTQLLKVFLSLSYQKVSEPVVYSRPFPSPSGLEDLRPSARMLGTNIINDKNLSACYLFARACL